MSQHSTAQRTPAPAAKSLVSRGSARPGAILQRACACGKPANGGGECEDCKKKRLDQERAGQLQRTPIGPGSAARAAAPDIIHAVLHGSGQPLDAGARGVIEPRIGQDLSRVRVHTDAAAAASAQAVNALAYTVGAHIVFGSGQYMPGAQAGQRLIAHELAHVIQQDYQPVPPHAPIEIGAADTPQEQEAEKLAAQVMRPAAPAAPAASSGAIGRPAAPAASSGAAALTSLRTSTVQRQLITPLGQGGGFGGLLDRDRKEQRIANNAELSVAEALAGDVDRIKELKEGALRSANIAQRLAMLQKLITATWTGSSEEEAIIRILKSTPQAQAAEMIKQMSDQQVGGRSYLKALDDVVDLGNNLELHAVLSELRLKAKGSKKGTEDLTTAPVLPWHDVMGFFEDDATFFVSTNKDGKVVVKYPVRTRTAKDFASEIKQLPLEMFISGYAYDPDQVLVIHDYDTGKYVPVVAQELIGYQHSGIRGFLGHVATVASLVTPVGAARTAIGKAAILILERVLPVIFLLVDENRLNLVKWFPKWGPRMIYFADIAKVGVGIYGLGRFATTGYKFFASWKEARQARALLEGAGAAPDAEKVALALEKQADDIFKEVEKLEAAESATVKGAGEAAPAANQAPAAAQAGPAKTVEQLADEAKAAGGAKQAGPAPQAKPAAAAPQGKVPDIFEGITEETQDLLRRKPQLKQALIENPAAARLLKLCKSLCFPENATPDQIRRLQKLVEEAEHYGVEVSERHLNEYLHSQNTAEKLEKAIAGLEEEVGERIGRVESPKAGQVKREFAEAGGAEPPEPAIPPDTATLRSQPGVATGGDSLKDVSGRWFADGRIGTFPAQIARRMKGMHFKNWRDFRETFWKLVAADSELSKGWRPAQLKAMRNGWAPHVPRGQGVGGGANAVYQLDHKQALQFAGELYDMDNIQVVSPAFHQALGD